MANGILLHLGMCYRGMVHGPLILDHSIVHSPLMLDRSIVYGPLMSGGGFGRWHHGDTMVSLGPDRSNKNTAQ